ncbi:MAG TPA: hypothetical protein VFN22_04670 [Gemmatimonadales bacterium]|nr:hypothetical protein [Gemmatimonadales bacterium]
MPPIARRFLFAAASSLLVGVLLGSWLLLRRELAGVWPSPYLVSAHVHLVMVGAVLQVIAGVALWMFPRPLRDDTRRHEEYGVIGWWLLTPGTFVRAAAEASKAWFGWSWLPGVVVGGALLQFAGIACVLFALRTRLRPSGAVSRREPV